MTKKINAAIIGASGYTGVELIRILLTHEHVEIKHLVAESNAGLSACEIYTHLSTFALPSLVKLNEVDFEGIDVVFCCLPHATSQKIIKELPLHLKVIDLSADFRLNDVDVYEKWYGNKHAAPELQEEAVYGLTEIFRDEIKDARIVACPGCYPTGATLPLFPLLKDGLIESSDIIIDAKTGVTGAGRAAKQAFLFTEVNEGLKPYNVNKHRHIPEIEQTLSYAGGKDIKVNFTPQLVPMSRGILSTIYVKTKSNYKVIDIEKSLANQYGEGEFVSVTLNGVLPSTRDVSGTNMCLISVVKGNTDNRVVIMSVIDNLTKGSSGQAVQNMNIMFGLDEACGLNYIPVFP
jgi:N-acetyl-gamma-glutamyl-phosphate reductase